MAQPSSNQTPVDSQAPVPIYLVDTVQADAAWDAFKAVQLTAARNPSLLANPYFTALQDAAYARFRAVFEAL